MRASPIISHRRTALTLVTAGAVGVLAAPAAFAQDGANANTVKLQKAGTTTLTLDKGTASALERLRITVIPVKPSTAARRTIRFGITSGSLDPRTATPALINHSGGLTLQRGKTKVSLRNLRIRVSNVRRSSQFVGANATLSAVVGGNRVTVATLDGRKADVTRPRRGPTQIATKVSNVVVKLNKTGASTLNRAFRTRAFTQGTRLGKTVVDARPSQVIVEQGSTALTLDPGTTSLLTGAGITPGVIAPATADPAGFLKFPITPGSRMTWDLGSGTIRHTGGMSLTKGTTKLSLTDFDIRIATANTLAASVNGAAAKTELLDLDLTSGDVKVEGVEETGVIVSGVKAVLNQTASDALTATFGTPPTKGATLGTVRITAELR